MRPLIWLVLSLALAAGPGCMLMPKTWLEARGTRSDAEPPAPPPVVEPDEVTATNYPSKIGALDAEVGYAETHPPSQVTVHTVDGVK